MHATKRQSLTTLLASTMQRWKSCQIAVEAVKQDQRARFAALVTEKVEIDARCRMQRMRYEIPNQVITLNSYPRTHNPKNLSSKFKVSKKIQNPQKSEKSLPKRKRVERVSIPARTSLQHIPFNLDLEDLDILVQTLRK